MSDVAEPSRPLEPASSRCVALLLLLGVALIYVALSRGMFVFGDDVLMYQVTEAIVERRSVDVRSPTLDEAIPIDPRAASSFNAAAIPGEDGRGYAKYGIGISLVAIPAYSAGDVLAPLIPVRRDRDQYGNDIMGPRVYATTLSNALIGAAIVSISYLLAAALGFRRLTALLLALVAAFATPLAHYSGTFLSEPLAALCLTSTVYGVLRASQTGDIASQASLRWLLLSGFAAGLGVTTKPAVGVALVAPALWMLWLAWRGGSTSARDTLSAAVAWGAPVAGWLAVIAVYNWSRFGSVTETGYGDEAGAYSTPFLTGLYGLLASPGRGLLWYAPPLLLALAGARRFYRRSPVLSLVILGVLASTLLLYSRYYAWHGGGVWGPRFLVPILPLLILPAGEIFERAWERPRVAAFAIASVLLGLLVSALAVLVPFDRYVAEYTADSTAHDRALWSVSGSPIIVHARDAARLDVTLDVAAVRYSSPRLAALSLVTGLMGITLLAVICLRIVGELRLPGPAAEPHARHPP